MKYMCYTQYTLIYDREWGIKMEFNDYEAIYVQIAYDQINKIIQKELKPGDMLLSVRKMAKQYGVTPRTIQNVFKYIENAPFIEKKQGVGYYVTMDEEKVALAKQNYILNQIDSYYESLEKIGIDKETAKKYFNQV